MTASSCPARPARRRHLTYHLRNGLLILSHDFPSRKRLKKAGKRQPFFAEGHRQLCCPFPRAHGSRSSSGSAAQRPRELLYPSTPRPAQLMGFYSCHKETGGLNTAQAQRARVSQHVTDGAEPYHPITAPRTHPHGGAHRAQHRAGQEKAFTSSPGPPGGSLHTSSSTHWLRSPL